MENESLREAEEFVRRSPVLAARLACGMASGMGTEQAVEELEAAGMAAPQAQRVANALKGSADSIRLKRMLDENATDDELAGELMKQGMTPDQAAQRIRELRRRMGCIAKLPETHRVESAIKCVRIGLAMLKVSTLPFAASVGAYTYWRSVLALWSATAFGLISLLGFLMLGMAYVLVSLAERGYRHGRS